MVPVFPQEVLELIVDEVYSAYTSYNLRPVTVLLRAGRCFGPRCRKYLYGKIKLSLQEPPLSPLTLSESALRFLDLIRSTPSRDKLVKHVTYSLHFLPAEHDPVQMVESPAWQDLIELKQHLFNVDHVSLDFSGGYPEPLLTNTRFLRPIAIILPSSSFSTLSIETAILHPMCLLELLSHCPTVTALTLVDIETDSVYNDWPDTVPSSLPSMITELSLSYGAMFTESRQHFNIFKNLFSGVQRLVLLQLDFQNLAFSRRIRELIASMAYLDEIFVSTEYDDGFFIPELVHARSLCIEVVGVSSLCDVPTVLKDTTTARLERLALIIHTYRGLPAIDSLWHDMTSALSQSHLSALKTVCITFNGLYVDDEKLNVVRRCFHDSNVRAKFTVRTMPLYSDLHLGC